LGINGSNPDPRPIQGRRPWRQSTTIIIDTVTSKKEIDMETREHENTIANAWQSYAVRGDRASEEIVDQDIRRFMQETGETDYNAAMKSRRQQVRTVEAAMTPGTVRPTVRDRHYAGAELLGIAKEYQQVRPELNDKEAFNLALLSNPVLGEQYTGCRIRRDGAAEVAKFMNQGNDGRELTATEKLSKVVDGIPKYPDRSRDWPEVIRVVFQYPDTVEKAARETIDRLVKDLIREEQIWVRPFEFDDVKKKLVLRLRAKHYDLAKTLDSPRNVNERALKLMLNEQQ
jgi:hypothetical protein